MDRSTIDRRLLDFKPELELPAASEAGKPWRDEYGEMDFAARLLEAADADELKPVLADIVAAAGDGRQPALRTPMLRVLEHAARMVFPIDASRAPADLKRKAAAVFGLELEGLSPEDKEFEVARRFVRLAADAARQAMSRAGGQPAGAAVQRALRQAARRNAPGLLRHGAAPARDTSRIQVIDI
ncbi:hypothetical protein [Massilia sp. METH4]|uniref:hypothetical protein n=1 Tax=Massilia sp. METH4 TaxID=3123041 RepID=UPI0030D0B62A